MKRKFPIYRGDFDTQTEMAYEWWMLTAKDSLGQKISDRLVNEFCKDDFEKARILNNALKEAFKTGAEFSVSAGLGVEHA